MIVTVFKQCSGLPWYIFYFTEGPMFDHVYCWQHPIAHKNGLQFTSTVYV